MPAAARCRPQGAQALKALPLSTAAPQAHVGRPPPGTAARLEQSVETVAIFGSGQGRVMARAAVFWVVSGDGRKGCWSYQGCERDCRLPRRCLPPMVAAMKFDSPLLRGRLVRRYKRFLADVELDDGQLVTAHCANPGSMIGLVEPGTVVWLSESTKPGRKLKYNWEMLAVDSGDGPAVVGINTGHPNRLAAEAIRAGAIPELSGYATMRMEVKYGRNSRIDILLEDPGRPACYVEVKNVHMLRRPGIAEFPDSVTARGAKHLDELAAIAAGGARAVMLFLVQRNDASSFDLARDIDPHYCTRFDAACAAGVETLVYCCRLSDSSIEVERRIAFAAPASGSDLR